MLNTTQSNMTPSPAMTAQQRKFTERKSLLYLYKELVVGRTQSFFNLFLFEIISLFVKNLSGIVGLVLRSVLYKFFFKKIGKGLIFGSGVTIRQPSKISLGSKTIIDDFVTLDVRGDDASITIGDNVTIGRFTIITAKDAHITIGNAVNISTNCRIATQSRIKIGDSVLVAAYSYIGPGNHQKTEGTPLIESDMQIKGGVTIESHAWIGTHTTVLDGVSIGSEAIVGAHSLVRNNVEAGATVFGLPAKVIKN